MHIIPATLIKLTTPLIKSINLLSLSINSTFKNIEFKIEDFQ